MRNPTRENRRIFLFLALLALWSLVLVVPLLVLPGIKDAFRMPKLMLCELLGLISLVALALDRGGRGHGLQQWRSVVGSDAFKAVAPLVLVATLSGLASQHPEHSREALIDLWIGAACLVGWSVAVPRDSLWSLLRGLTLPAVPLAGLGLLQFFEVFQPFRFTGAEQGGREAITSLAGSTGDLAAFLVLPCLIAQLELWQSRRRMKAAWAAVLALCLWCMLATQTVAPLVALVVGSSVMWGLLLERRRLLLTMGLMALVLASTVWTVAPLRERIDRKWGQLRAGELNAVLTGRLDGWRTAIWMIEQQPLIGVGHGAYRAEFADAKLALTERGVEFYRGHRYAAFANAHNEYLESAAEWGLPGLAALAWALGVALRSMLRRGKRSSNGATLTASRRSLGWAGLAALGSLAVAYFPMRLALTAYPALLLFSVLLRSREEEP